jgi:hypothetical protein
MTPRTTKCSCRSSKRLQASTASPLHGYADPTWLVRHRVYLALGADDQERQVAYRMLCGAPVTEAEMMGQLGVRRVSDPGLTPAR